MGRAVSVTGHGGYPIRQEADKLCLVSVASCLDESAGISQPPGESQGIGRCSLARGHCPSPWPGREIQCLCRITGALAHLCMQGFLASTFLLVASDAQVALSLPCPRRFRSCGAGTWGGQVNDSESQCSRAWLDLPSFTLNPSCAPVGVCSL